MIKLESFVDEYFRLGKEMMADQMKSRIYLSDENLFYHINFDNDDAFLEPLAVLKYTYDPFPPYSYNQLLAGHTTDIDKHTEIYFDGDGRAYLPQIGYISCGLKNTIGEFHMTNGKIKIIVAGGEKEHEFDAIHFLPDSTIELVRFNNPLMAFKFGTKESIEAVDINKPYSIYKETICNALELIRSANPWFFSLIKASVQKVVLFESENIRSFAALNTLGIVYINTTSEATDIYFTEELIHQSAHNIMYFITIIMADYFAVDVKNKFIKEYTGKESDGRTIYSAVHGAFSLVNICSTFALLIPDAGITGDNRLEIVGRFADNFRRLGIAIQDIRFPQIYTPLGWTLFESIDARYQELSDKYFEFAHGLETANQPYVFSYKLFKDSNPQLSHELSPR